MGRFSLLLYMLISVSLFGQSLYLSDGLGNELTAITDITGEEVWYLKISLESGTSIRTLYHNQEEWKRWESRYTEEDSPIRIETYFFKNRIREIEEYNNSEQLLSEQFFDSRGEFLEHRRYILNQEGVRSKILLFNENGIEETTYQMLYREDGSLREIAGTDAAGETKSQILWRSGGNETLFDRVYMEDGTTAYRYDYENGRLSIRLRYRGDEEIEKTLYVYKDEGMLEKESVWNYSDNVLSVLYYDDLGQIVLENQFIKGILQITIMRTFKGDQLIQYQERSGNEKILWKYEYEEDTEDPVVSSLYRNGILVTKLIREGSQTKKIMYKNNEAVYENITDEGDGS